MEILRNQNYTRISPLTNFCCSPHNNATEKKFKNKLTVENNDPENLRHEQKRNIFKNLCHKSENPQKSQKPKK